MVSGFRELRGIVVWPGQEPSRSLERHLSMSASNRKRPKDPAIVVPSPTDEQPRFGRVGAIAAVGFVVGVAWPSLGRFELVPQPPTDSGLAVPSPSGSSAGLGSAMPETSTEPALAIAPPAPKAVGPKVRLVDVISCVDADGKKRQRCDAPALDGALVEPLKGLLACDGAEGQAGALSLGFDIDFGTGELSHFTVGRSTTLDTALARSLADCAKSTLTHVDVSAIEHGYAHYRVFYVIEFTRSATESERVVAPPATGPTPGVNPSAGEGELQGQSGRATVTWDVAIVRKAPKDGAIVARVLGGTRVVVTARQGDWYRVKFNAKGDEGFVFKSAIGL